MPRWRESIGFLEVFIIPNSLYYSAATVAVTRAGGFARFADIGENPVYDSWTIGGSDCGDYARCKIRSGTGLGKPAIAYPPGQEEGLS